MNKINTPFYFGQVVSKENFVNRRVQLERFKQEVKSGIHQILISPRRWGKSSFVKQAMTESIKDKTLVYCFIDLFSIRSEQEFFETLSRRIVAVTHTKSDEVLKSIGQFLKGLKPRLEMSPDPTLSYNIKFEWEKNSKNFDEILNFPEKLAIQKKIRLVICLDEFQNVSEFTNGLQFQKLLRSQWQHHKNVTYCLYGSKRSMMSELFEKQKMPFYRFGTTFYLDKIKKEEFVDYIIQRFDFTSKKINSTLAEKIVNLMERHPYYVQQFSHFVWIETKKIATDLEFQKAIDLLFVFNSILYQKIFEDLSNQQINLLKVLVFENEKVQLTSKNIIQKYQLGTSATVLRSLAALEKKEVIDRFTSQIEFIDPGFKFWLKIKIFEQII